MRTPWKHRRLRKCCSTKEDTEYDDDYTNSSVQGNASRRKRLGAVVMQFMDTSPKPGANQAHRRYKWWVTNGEAPGYIDGEARFEPRRCY